MHLIRHAETVWNRDRIGYGHTDIPLSSEGYAAAWAYHLPAGVHRLFTSPLTRAFETAAVIAHHHSLPTPTIATALIELDHGTGEGIPKPDLPDIVPGRETDDQIRSRVLLFLTHLTPDCLIVTHAGVIRALTGQKVNHLETIEWQPQSTQALTLRSVKRGHP
jgi:broad specificity phosphatase PhoE